MSCTPVVDRPLRVAFIGAGHMARNHLTIIRAMPAAAVVVGVTDALPRAAAQFAALAGVQSSSSVAALLADTHPDVVHVCTPPTSHFDAARAALDSGAHVYVEKPFALTTDDACELIALARARRRLVCAGHQLLKDAAFEQLVEQAPALGTIVQVDSHFSFRPVASRVGRGGARGMAAQIIDILPHPLYTLVDILERFGSSSASLDLAWVQGGGSDLHATLRAGDLVGRLSVSLRGRPVASSLSLVGTKGTLTCDFVRSMTIGAGNPGTEALEKIFNPIVEGFQLVTRTVSSVSRRVRSGVSYPGLQPLIEGFYRAICGDGQSPVSTEHLVRVTMILEQLVASIQTATDRRTMVCHRPSMPLAAPRAVVTGARGFLGSEIARALGRVRGIGRGPDPDDPHVVEWIQADLSSGLPTGALVGAEVVVHAAAETSGGYDAHHRNSVEATRRLLQEMGAAGVSRLVLVSSLSVVRPPRTPWEHQDEATPRPDDPRPLGAYTWGKSLQEELVEREATALGIATRIIRPGALLDSGETELPGLLGRHLYGRWHLGLGRPALPIAVCDVTRCAEAIAWVASHFDEAPAVVNLLDPALATRADVVSYLRQQGWNGRIVWVPISLISMGMAGARILLSLGRGRLPERLATWSVLRPRRFDTRAAAALLHTARADADVRPALRA